MVESAEKGQEEALTRAKSGENPENFEAAAIAQLLATVNAAPELPGLDDHSADEFDVLGKLAENINAKRRGAGRPSGSANKRNDEMFDYLEARGFKAPELRLMEIVSADTRALAAALAGPSQMVEHVAFDKVLDVLKLQVAAAKELLPYKFAKKHEVKHEINARVAHVMMAGRLTEPGHGQAVEFSLTGETVEYQEVNPLPPKPVG